MDKLPIPNHETIDMAINMAPTSIQPIARQGVQWVRQKIGPLKELEVQEGVDQEAPSPPPSPESHLGPEMTERRQFSLSPEMELPKSSEELDGSAHIFPAKIRISPESENRVAEELKDAMSRDLFQPLWPYVKENQLGKREDRGGRGTTKVQCEEEELDESIVFSPELTEEAIRRKEEIMRGWKAKKDRPPSKPTTGFGSLNDEEVNRRLEDLSMFNPTLPPHLRFRPVNRDFAEDGKSSKHKSRKGGEESGFLKEERQSAEAKAPRQKFTKQTQKSSQVKQEHQEKVSQKHSNQTDKHQEKNISQTSNESESHATSQRLQRLRMPRYRYDEQDSDDELPFAPRK
ncbi:uncharacterized protein BP5553_01439 [Venustampulla echinocandica]|uniref:Uncharacterized protein n=1 Tax=Venustampulla echinocandica TaxID=2656787 RepID=A0A370U0Z6_9HELO|nr:uncharacterized protein BP5553_01439 [Venustampulla echinocandica]RDL41460.1 hypothetical protein BP5553_01439 [Venustampulla echinocandica]